MSDHSIDEDLFFGSPGGPIELVYGSESPIKVANVSRHISHAKKRRRPIHNLSFLGCDFHDGTQTAFRALGKKLRMVKNVKEFAINGIPSVGNEELSSLAPFLNANDTLRSLDLTGATFNTKGIKGINRFFRRNSSLEVLVVGENECVGDEGVENIVSSLQAGRPRRLQVLAVESCGVGYNGSQAIANFMMQGGTSLRVLELSNNEIGDLGAEVLAGSIKRGHRLGHLGLNNAGIGDRGAQAFAKMLKFNRSLHTLSLQNNTEITNVGASSLHKAVYNDDSIKTIIKSNHVLKNLNWKGCSNVSRDLLQLSTQLSAHSRLLSTKDAVIRLKVSSYLKKSGCGVALEDFDLELMPFILAFVGKSNGITSLFHTLKSMPVLYTQYDHQAKNLDEEEEKEEEEEEPVNNNDFLEQLKLSSRRARKYYAIFANRIPKRSSMLRYQDRRINNKHESSVSATNSEHYLSSKNNGNSNVLKLKRCGCFTQDL